MSILNAFEYILNVFKNRCMTIEEQEKLVYARLRQEREKHGLSQMELALESGVSQNMITYIETGKRTPTIKTILKLCNTMHIDPASLFPRSDDDKLTAKRTVLDLIERYM